MSRELPNDNPRLQLLGLFHDAGEAYIGDIPRPLKAEQEVFERIEERILDAVWESFDIAPPSEEEWRKVMEADDRLLAYEANNILEGGDWAGRSPELEYDLQSSSIERVRERFLTRSEALLDQVQ